MSDQEQIDVMTTDDASETSPIPVSAKCRYCDCEKEGLPVFHCESCGKWVHTSCLHSGSPSPILFDNFYIFKCVCCSETGKESFTRMRLTWNQVTALALFNIAQSSPGKQGFHKWKDTVGVFVDKHWDLLFESYKKKSGNWMNTIAATLSTGNPHQFTSGYGFFKESGWWKLTDPSIPPEYTPQSSDVKQKVEGKGRKSRSFVSTPAPSAVSGKVEGLRKRSYLSSAFNASQLKEKRSRTQKSNKNSDTQEEGQREAVTPTSSEGSPPSFKGCTSPISSPLSSPRSLSVTSMLSKGDMVPDTTLPLAILSDDSDIEQDERNKSCRPSSSDKFFSPLPMDISAMSTPCTSPPAHDEAELDPDTSEHPKLSTDSRSHANSSGDNNKTVTISNGNSAFCVVNKKKKLTAKDSEEEQADTPRIREMSLYEERALLKKLESYGEVLKEVPEAYRLRRKLLVRQEKRELNIPIVSFDSLTRRLVAQEKKVALPESGLVTKCSTGVMRSSYLLTGSSPHHRILDRFQSPGFSLSSDGYSRRTFRQKLVGCDEAEMLQPVISPYTQRILKPYILRDYESKPPKLALMKEIISHYRSKMNVEEGLTTASAPIDFCYVRPRHIPTINAMCQHFFWPGVDLSESLQYPDFSIVALYKKMVIGFGFMVPDVNFNEAYISFLLIHPDWQRAGLGTFMIYHLIQTCMGKEVTLHVSASNPAMLLYQKFGFKPEKFITDFYDKYHSVDSTECKHAFFMRLRR